MRQPSVTSRSRPVWAACVALILVAACAAVPGTVGGSGAPSAARADAFALRRDFAEAADLFLAGDFARARDAFRRVASDGDGSAETARAWHSLGRCELALGRPAAARTAFARALDRASADASLPADVRAYALAGLADAALASGRPAEALDHLGRIADEGLAGRLAADELVFRRASALEALGRRSPAARDYRRLARTWPSSSLAAEAAARAEALEPSGASGRAGPAAYEVRAGAFRDRGSAEAAAEALKGRGFRPRVAGLEVGGERLFTVLIGSFSAREAADALAREAVRAGFPARVEP